jgi:Outer membrane protein beta-barrel domain
MSDMKNFEDFLHDGLNNHSSDVPSHIWDNIVAARNKRKPGGFWLGFLNNRNMLLLTGLLLAGGAGIAIFNTPIGSTNKISSSINNNNASKNITLTTNNKSLNTVNTNTPSSTTNKSLNRSFNNKRSSDQINYSTASVAETNNSRSNDLSSNNTNTTASNDNALNTTATNDKALKSTTVSTSNYKHDNTVNRKTKRYFIAGIENIDIVQANNTVDVQPNRLATTTDNYTSLTASSKTAKRTFHHHTADGSTKGYMDATGNNAITDNDLIEGSDDLNTADNNQSNLFVQGYLSNRLQDSAQKIAIPAIEANTLAKLNLPECPTVEKNTAGNKQYVEAYIGPDYGIRTLTDSSKSNSAYLQQRKQSTSFSSAFSAGLRYTKVLRSGISFAAGLNYSQINEKFTVAENNISVVERTVDNRGNVISTDTITGTQYKTSHNHYHSIDVPVLFGYEMGNDKIHVNINAGPVMNIYSWQHGQVLSQDSIPESISSGKSSSLAYQYKTNIGLGITGGVSVYYKLNDQLHVFAEPYFRYNFGSMNNSESPIQQKYTTIGMHIGLRLDLK